MPVTLSLIWRGLLFFNGIAGAKPPVLTIVLGHVGYAATALIFHEMGGSCDADELPDLASLFVEGFLNNAIPFGLKA